MPDAQLTSFLPTRVSHFLLRSLGALCHPAPRICRLLAMLAFVANAGPMPAGAQAPAAADGEVLEEIAEPAPPADAPAPAAAAAAPAAPAAPPAAAAPPPEVNYLSWFTGALGPFYSVVFLGLSFSLVGLVVMNILAARRTTIVPPQLIADFEAQLKDKKYQEAYGLAKADESFLGQVLSAGLAKVNQGYDKAVEAMQEVGEEENLKLEQRLSYIALIGTISPMVGLLGTVDGMVDSFTVIANSSVTPKPSELAQGISTALVTTLVGLWLAIPAIAVYHILRNRVARLVLEVGIQGESLMSRFQTPSAKKTAPPA